MSLEFHPWEGLFFLCFFIIPILQLWANAPKNEDSDKYKVTHDSIQSESIDLSKMGANEIQSNGTDSQ